MHDSPKIMNIHCLTSLTTIIRVSANREALSKYFESLIFKRNKRIERHSFKIFKYTFVST